MKSVKLISPHNDHEVDALAVVSYDCLLRAVALLEFLDSNDLVWLRSRLSDATPCQRTSETLVLDAMRQAIDDRLDD